MYIVYSIILFFAGLSAYDVHTVGSKRMGSEQPDSIALKKKYQTPQRQLNYHFYEKIELKSDNTFEYSLKADLIRKNAKGYWSVSNNALKLADDDKSPEMTVEEKYVKWLPAHVKRFYVTDSNNEPIGCSLILLSKKRVKYVREGLGERTDISVPSLSSFQIRSVKDFQFYTPKPGSNFFRIKINAKKAFFTKTWKVLGNRISPLNKVNGFSDKYYLEEF